MVNVTANMIQVTSSNIKAIGYEDGDLFVEYNSGLYMYKNVPKRVYDELMRSSSKGSYMNMYVKGVYDYDYLR